jgi:two-component system, NarL family, response regulator NreC
VPPRTDSKEINAPDVPIRCVLAHDHVLLRQGVKRLLQDEPDIDVVGEAGNAAECLRKVHELRPDIVVAGAKTFDVPVAEAKLRVEQESSNTRVVLLSANEQTSPPLPARRETDEVFAARHTSAEELVEMVRRSCNDNREPSSPFAPQNCTEPGIPSERNLTVREREVLKLMAEGKTVRSAAEILGLSAKTVDAHKFNLMRKIGVHNKAQLVVWAIQKKVLRVPVNF